jgi:hypothetical protein
MPRVLLVACLVAAILLSGCQTIGHAMGGVKDSLSDESWWDEHPIATTVFCGAAVAAAVVGVVAVIVLVTEADNHNVQNQSLSRSAQIPQSSGP